MCAVMKANFRIISDSPSQFVLVKKPLLGKYDRNIFDKKNKKLIFKKWKYYISSYGPNVFKVFNKPREAFFLFCGDGKQLIENVL